MKTIKTNIVLILIMLLFANSMFSQEINSSEQSSDKQQVINKDSDTLKKNNPVKTKEIQLLFTSAQNNIYEFDVKVNDIFVGTFGFGKNLLVSNIDRGTTKIELFITQSPNKEVKSFLTKEFFQEPGIYNLNFIYFDNYTSTELIKLIKTNKKTNKRESRNILKLFEITEKQDLNSKEVYSSYDIKDTVNNRVKPRKSIYTASKFSFSPIITKPDNAKGVGFNFKLGTSTPFKNSNIFYEIPLYMDGYYYTFVNSGNISLLGMGILPTLGYQIEPSKKIIIQAFITAGPYVYWLSYESMDDEFGISFIGYFGINTQYYFNNTFGILGEVIVDYNGNFGYSIGITSRIINEYKYRYKDYE